MSCSVTNALRNAKDLASRNRADTDQVESPPAATAIDVSNRDVKANPKKVRKGKDSKSLIDVSVDSAGSGTHMRQPVPPPDAVAANPRNGHDVLPPPGVRNLEMLAATHNHDLQARSVVNGHVYTAPPTAAMGTAGLNAPPGVQAVPFSGGVPLLGPRPDGIFAGPPLPMDVVVGREALLYNQEGNLHLQNIVRANIGRDTIPTEVKHVMARAILYRMKQLGSRFCIKETYSQGIWYQLSDLEAQDVIYRGLCEEEKKLQIVFGPPKEDVFESSGAGRGRSMPGAQLPLAGPSEEPSRKRSLEPSKKKYKKRLRKLTEVAKTSRLDGDDEVKIQEPSDSSSSADSSVDDDGHNIILENDIDIGPYDVILGRGRGSFNHPGNQNLIHVFRSNKVRYGNASKLQKTRIAREIVTSIQKKGGRFLKRHDDDKWEVIANKDAYRKVCHGIRDLRESEKHFVDYIRPEELDVVKEMKTKQQCEKESSESLIPPGNNKPTKGTPLTGIGSADMQNVSSKLFERGGKTPDNLMKDQSGREEEPDDTDVPGRDDEGNDDVDGDDDNNDDSVDHDHCDDYDDDDSDDVDLDGSSGDSATKRSGPGRIEGRDLTMSEQNSREVQTGVVVPRDEDIVCGRGKALNRHPGNQRMHKIVKKYKYRYRDARNQDEKAKIANKVLAAIQSNGGRLLRLNDNGEWQELEYKVGLKKVYHSIRDSLYNDDGKRMRKRGDNENDDVYGRGRRMHDDTTPASHPDDPAKMPYGNSKYPGPFRSPDRGLSNRSTPPPREAGRKSNEEEDHPIDRQGREKQLRAPLDAAVEENAPYFNQSGLENISDPMLRARLAIGMSDPLIRAQLMEHDIRLRRAEEQEMPQTNLGTHDYHGVPQYDLHLSRLHSLASVDVQSGALPGGGYGLNRGMIHRAGPPVGGVHGGYGGPTPSAATAATGPSISARFPSSLSGSNQAEEEMRRMIYGRYGV